jgi:hypothetical protein
MIPEAGVCYLHVGLMICRFLIDLDKLSQLHRSVRLFKKEVIPRVAA